MKSRESSPSHLHFVGIGGIGMSGIAEVFLNQGFRISGSDLTESDLTRKLADLGATITIGHAAENIAGAHVCVVSSAVKETNPEVMEARRLRIPVIPRGEMLAELMRGKIGIAVAGTHGKTTTTSMLAVVLTSAGLDPTLVIGGKVDSLGGNAKLGKGAYVVAEADESDGSFLRLPATYGIITNIDNDHLDHYGSLAAVEEAFIEFVGQIPLHGFTAVCVDDPGVRRCLSRFGKRVLTYGIGPESEGDYYATDLQAGDSGMSQTFRFWARGTDGSKSPGTNLGKCTLQRPGRHNVLNALAVLTVGMQLDLPFEQLARGLAAFTGVKRRFEIRWQDPTRNRMIIDDYGHHPTEIAATLAAARSAWQGRIVTVFQPHRYTRTLHCHDAFLTAFKNSDIVHVLDIYPAGEDPIPGVTSEALVRDLRLLAAKDQTITYAGGLAEAQGQVLRDFRDGDLLLCLGAGSITKLPDTLITALGSQS